MKIILFPLLLCLSLFASAQNGSSPLGITTIAPPVIVDNKVYVETSGNIEGGFQLYIVLGVADASFSLSEINVTNGSAANLSSADNKSWTANIIPTGAGDVVVTVPTRASNSITVTVNTDWKFLTQSSTSDIYYEFREFISDQNVATRSTDPGLNDLSGNARNLSLINTPTCGNLLSAADVALQIMTLRTTTTGGVSIGSTGSAFFSRAAGFSVQWAVRSNDGQSTTAWAICGNTDATNIGLIIDVTTGGNLRIKYQGFVWQSTSSVFVNATTGLHAFEAHFDFPNNTLTVYKDNATVAGSFTSGNINTTTPGSYACSQNFYIGTYNNNGTAFSNPNTDQITYFAVTTLQSSNRNAIYTYLLNREANVTLVATVSGVPFPHDAVISADLRHLYASCKGDDVLTTVDGAFVDIDVSTPTSPVKVGTYTGHANQKDGETVLALNPWRVMHFVDQSVLMFDVSNSKNPIKLSSVAYSGSSVNGAVQSRLNHNYVFGANKGGYISVFDVTNPDSFTLVGEYSSTADGLGGPHDIDFTDDGMHIIVCNRITGAVDIGIYQVLNSDGSLIALGSWVLKGSLSSATVSDTNRARVLQGENAVSAVMTGSGTNYFYTVDITTLTAPTLLTTFDILNKGTGLTFYRNRFSIPTWTQGLRVLKTDSPGTITEVAGYCNTITFTAGNANFHDDVGWEKDGVHYIAVTAQSDSKILIFKILRL